MSYLLYSIVIPSFLQLIIPCFQAHPIQLYHLHNSVSLLQDFQTLVNQSCQYDFPIHQMCPFENTLIIQYYSIRFTAPFVRIEAQADYFHQKFNFQFNYCLTLQESPRNGFLLPSLSCNFLYLSISNSSHFSFF